MDAIMNYNLMERFDPDDNDLLFPITRIAQIRAACPWMAELDAHTVLVHNVDRLNDQYGKNFSPETMTSMVNNFVHIFCQMDEQWQRDRLAVAKEFYL